MPEVEAAPETPVAETPAPEPVVEAAPEPGPAPWAKTLETAFEDETERARVDAYLRAHHQPYVTKVEAERAAALAEAQEARDKAWVYDSLNEDPAAALREIATQVYDAETADRIVELLEAGATPAEAEEQAVEESAAELPADVKETIEWAKAQREAQAAAEAQAAEEAAIAEAKEELETWVDKVLAENEDIIRGDLYAYVAIDGDMEGGLAAYRAEHPAPEPKKPAPPATLGGGRSNGGVTPARRMSSLAEAAGSVFDAAKGGGD